MDLNDGNATERFLFKLNEAESKNMSFQGVNEFTGIEWWNKYGNSSFPIRYKIEFSNLRYAQESVEVQELDKEENIEHVIFKPYDALVPNKMVMPKNILLALTVQASRIAVCMCYTVTNGSCRTGLRFLHAC